MKNKWNWSIGLMGVFILVVLLFMNKNEKSSQLAIAPMVTTAPAMTATPIPQVSPLAWPTCNPQQSVFIVRTDVVPDGEGFKTLITRISDPCNILKNEDALLIQSGSLRDFMMLFSNEALWKFSQVTHARLNRIETQLKLPPLVEESPQ